MGCGEFIVKYVLFFANLFFAIAGLGLLGVGVAVQLKVSGVIDVLEGYNVSVAPILAMAVGGVVFLIAFFGCCGAIKESHCMLVTYSIFMIILLVLKVTLAVLVFVNLSAFKDEIPRLLNEAFSKNQNAFSETVEATFQCCGPSGPLAYVSVSLPDTCCATPPCNVINAYGGCIDTVKDFTTTFGNTIGGVAIIVACIELVAVVFALCLANTVRNKERRARY